MYEVDRPDQYVDVMGVPDGVYELVSRADEDNTVLESNEDDNEASVVFRLTGETIEVLATHGPTGPFGDFA
jgi:subtilase family serine protease